MSRAGQRAGPKGLSVFLPRSDKAQKGDNTMEERLHIISVSGYPHLFFQFIYPEEYVKTNDPAYHLLSLIMYNVLSEAYRDKGREERDDETAFRVNRTEHDRGFTLSIDYVEAKEEKALRSVKALLEYVVSFDPDAQEYVNGRAKDMVFGCIDRVKDMARELLKEIFEDHSYTYKTEYWSFFD